MKNSGTADALREERLRLLAPAAVVVLTFFAFSGSLSNGLVNWDDRQAFLSNTSWRGLDPARLRWMLTAFELGHYQPLSWLTLGLDYEIWGLSAFGIHLTSLLLHCGAALVAYFIGLRLLKDRLWAAAAALLFSLHPLRVESVAWAAERRDPLSGLFFLWTLLCWLDGRRRGALLCALLTLSAKLTGLTLPAILLLLDVYPLGRLPADPRRWAEREHRAVLLEKLPFAALSLVFLALNVYAQVAVDAMPSLAAVGWPSRLGRSVYSFFFYLGKTLRPVDLSPLYYGTDFSAPLLGLCAAAALAAAALASRRLRPALAAAGAFYAIALIPYLGIVRSGRQVAADRYTYVACLPWALLAAAGLAAAARGRRRPAALAATAALLLALGAAARRQTALWHDSVALWRHALSLDPLGDTARPILAEALLERGRVGEAVLYLEEQLRLFPGDFHSRKLLTEAAGKRGFTDEQRARTHRELAKEFLERGERGKADWHLRKARGYEERPGRL